MEELLELQRVKEKEQVQQTRSLKEANAEIRRQKNNQDMTSQKVIHPINYLAILRDCYICRKNRCIRMQNNVKDKQTVTLWH